MEPSFYRRKAVTIFLISNFIQCCSSVPCHKAHFTWVRSHFVSEYSNLSIKANKLQYHLDLAKTLSLKLALTVCSPVWILHLTNTWPMRSLYLLPHMLAFKKHIIYILAIILNCFQYGGQSASVISDTSRKRTRYLFWKTLKRVRNVSPYILHFYTLHSILWIFYVYSMVFYFLPTT